MSWGNIRMHLIGAEDLQAEGYPCDEVARAWQGTKKWRRTERTEREPHQKKHGRNKRAKILLGQGEGELPDFIDFGSDSGSLVSSLNSIADSDSSSGGSGSGSGTSGSSRSDSGSD